MSAAAESEGRAAPHVDVVIDPDDGPLLEVSDLLDELVQLKPRPATVDEVLRFHTPAYVESIQQDVRWLGYDWEDRLFFASDYFEEFYRCAVKLIEKGTAYGATVREAARKLLRGNNP